MPVVEGVRSLLESSHKAYGHLHSKALHHNSRRRVSCKGISFLTKMAIMYETEPPVVQAVAAVFSE